MKKLVILLFLSISLFGTEVFADFYATNLSNGSYYSYGQVLKLDSKVEVYGLLSQESINLKLKLGPYNSWDWQSQKYILTYPPSGKYEFVWNFTLPKDAIIKDLRVWNSSTGTFLETAVIDLTTGESKYNPSAVNGPNVILKQYMRRDYNGSYNLQYELRISPVNWDESAEFIIDLVSPCIASYEKRQVGVMAGLFSTYSPYDGAYVNTLTNISAIDYNNQQSQPQYYSGNNNFNWSFNNGFWNASENNYNSTSTIYFPSESSSGKFLRTSTDDLLKFYQLATKPQLPAELRYPRKIIVACDLINSSYGTPDRSTFINMIKQTLSISTTDQDSLMFVTSDFNVRWLNNSFQKRTDELINTQMDIVNSIVPKLNTLPYMLKEIVQVLNSKNTDAEVWLISDDYQTGVRAETVMDLLNQTYYSAKNKIVFNILDASQSYYSYYIQNVYYRGNGYLYQNLTRLSGGNSGSLYNSYYIDYIDAALDTFAPKVTSVEIDPVPASGFTYSRIDLNKGRNNFNLTSRYYQIGILEGTLPIDINYYGNYLNNYYFNDIKITEDNVNVSDNLLQNTSLFWYGNYILNDLFLQPQSFSTITYIESLSVKKHIITPYSAFIIPAPDGYEGFVRVYEDQIKLPVITDKKEIAKALPAQISLGSYPNPFNPSTTISIQLTSEALSSNKSLDIYNIIGQKVKSIDLSPYLNSTEFTVRWNGLNDFGQQAASGVYIAVLRTKNDVKTVKLQLIR
jgi:hypothetical protein